MAKSQALWILSATAALLALAAGETAQGGSSPPAPIGSTGDWESVFVEDFEDSSLDLDKWTKCFWWNDRGCTNLGTKELSWYLPGNVSVEDGLLHLEARKEDTIGHEGRTFNYTSGMVTTGRDYSELPRPPRFDLLYGHIEIRARLPKGRGFWPAFWLLPSDRQSTPEIDMVEVLGHDTGTLRMHYHYRDGSEEKHSNGKNVMTRHDLSQDWHVYGVEWRPDAIIWYLDGIEQWRYEGPGISKEKMYLLINFTVGGEYAGHPSRDTSFPAELLVDYVRIWQRPAN